MKTKELVLCALCAVFIVISAWISIPSVVPFTMQTFAIYFIIFTLTEKTAFFSVLTYILTGFIGLPVFAGFKGGIGVITGATGGYILGFLLIPAFMLLCKNIYKKNNTLKIIFSFISLIICYIFGTLWFYLLYADTTGISSFMGILSMCVIPFIIPDIIKMTLAFVFSKAIKHKIKNIQI